MEQVLVEELDGYRRQFEKIKKDAEILLAGLSDGQFNWQPAPGRWSMAQCILHLNVTAGIYIPMMDAVMERVRAQGLFGHGPFRHGWLGNWLVRLVEPPPKRKFKAPKTFVPPLERPLGPALSEFLSWQDQFLERIRRANGLNLGRAKIRLPASSLIKLSLGQSFALMTAHERRHLWQAAQVREAAGFPS